ncbi:MAG: hypothetical protein QGG73_01800 [Candidatus Hydrogenedentes bacterium]|nr:hypothetical protein [Candidatus Hydrogenedentota bacterium]
MGVLVLVGLFAILFALFIFTFDRPSGPSRSISESVSDHFGRGR